MKFKKLASLLIVGAMLCSMAMPAFANLAPSNNEPVVVDNGGGGNGGDNGGGGDNAASNQPSDLSRSLKFTGTTSVPTINVDMATEAAIVLNPYGLTVSVGGDDKTDPFLSETVIVTNRSNCPIAISGSFTPSVTGDVTLVAKADDADTGKADTLADKNVFVGVAIGNVAAEDTEIDFTATTGDYRTKVKGATAANKFGAWQPKTGTGNDVYAGSKQGFYPLPTKDTAVKFGDGEDTQSGKVPYTLGAGNEDPTYFGMRIFGLCEKYVKEAWTTDDTVSVALAVTIAPNSN